MASLVLIIVLDWLQTFISFEDKRSFKIHTLLVLLTAACAV